MKLVQLAAACLALSGCVSGGKTPVPAAQFAAQPGFNQSRILGTETVSVNTSTPQQRGIVSFEKNMAGSGCIATSSEITVRFTTPAKVQLPVIKGQPSPLTIRCTNGALTGTRTLQPELVESNESGNTVLEQGNILAGIAVGVIQGAQERAEARARDAWRYVEQSTGVSLK